MTRNPSVKGSGNPSGNPSINPSPNPSTKGYPNPWDNPSNPQQEPFTDPFGKPIGEPMPHTKHLTPSNHQPSPWQPSTQNRHLSDNAREEQQMELENSFGKIEPTVEWGYCPGSSCDGEIEWHEEGPVCTECGHLWDANGEDIGTWEDNMGEPWAESSTKAKFDRGRAKAKARWDDIRAKAGAHAA